MNGKQQIIDKKQLKKISFETIMSSEEIQQLIAMKRQEYYLSMHQNKIWQGRDGNWYTYLPDDEKGRRFIKRKDEKTIKKVVSQYYEKKCNEPTFPPVFHMWLTEKEEFDEIRKSTITKYENDFKRFFPDNEPFCKIKLVDMTDRELELFLKRAISKHKLTKKTFSGLKIIVRSVFRYAKREGYTEYSISTFFGDLALSDKLFATKRRLKKEEQVFNGDEANALISYFRNNPTIHNLGLKLMFETGLRIGELVALRREDIGDSFISITKTEICYKDKELGKHVFEIQDDPKSENGIRQVIIPESAKQTISSIIKINPFGEYLFMKDGKRINSYRFNRYLEKACKNIRIPVRSTHKIRKTYASALIDSGVNKSLVMEQMGHADITTTEKYYYFNRESDAEKRRAINHAVAY